MIALSKFTFLYKSRRRLKSAARRIDFMLWCRVSNSRTRPTLAFLNLFYFRTKIVFLELSRPTNVETLKFAMYSQIKLCNNSKTLFPRTWDCILDVRQYPGVVLITTLYDSNYDLFPINDYANQLMEKALKFV